MDRSPAGLVIPGRTLFHQRFLAVPCRRHVGGWTWSPAGLATLWKNTVPSAVLCCTLPETRPRADPEFCWIDWSSSEEKLCLHRLSPVPCRRHGRGCIWSPAGLATLGRTLFHQRFSAAPCRRHGRGCISSPAGLATLERTLFHQRFSALPCRRHGRGRTSSPAGLATLGRTLFHQRFSAVPCQRHGRGWTWDLDGLVILRRIMVYHRFSAVPCQRHGRGWTWGVLMAWLYSEE